MSENDNKIVHVDASIELRDYFHAYVDSAKINLVIGCGIIAILMAGFIYFFTLIGEQKILWQLSPLFFGIPIIAIAGQFLRIHASYRKYLAGLSESEKTVHYIFPENADGFDIVRGKNFSHVAWESVQRVLERPRYFRFVLNRSDSIILPKRFISNRATEKELKEIIGRQLRNRASLL